MLNSFNFKVIDKFCKEFLLVKKAFHDIIKPIYGSQKAALEKIGDGIDRVCEGLFVDEQLKGVIVYKRELIEDKLEIKTLCLIDPVNDRRKGFGTKLIERSLDAAKRRNANKITLTVSAEADVIEFFKSHGFIVVGSEEGKYKEGATEYMLERSAELALKQYSSYQLNADQDKPLTCTLRKQYINAIASGHKTHEGRVNTSYFQKYQPGKTVTWFTGNDSVHTQIVSRQEFPSFDSMLKEIGFKSFLPEARTVDEANKLYASIPGYSEKVKKFGAVAFGLKLITPALKPSDSTYAPHSLNTMQQFNNTKKRRLDSPNTLSSQTQHNRDSSNSPRHKV